MIQERGGVPKVGQRKKMGGRGGDLNEATTEVHRLRWPVEKITGGLEIILDLRSTSPLHLLHHHHFDLVATVHTIHTHRRAARRLRTPAV